MRLWESLPSRSAAACIIAVAAVLAYQDVSAITGSDSANADGGAFTKAAATAAAAASTAEPFAVAVAAEAVADVDAVVETSATAAADATATATAAAADGSQRCESCGCDAAGMPCAEWAQMGECEKNPVFMHSSCAASCGCPVGQATVLPNDGAAAAASGAAATGGAAAAATAVAPDPSCADRDKTGACAHWAASGECEKNPAYMKMKCAASCHSCDMLDYGKRCPIAEDRVPAVPPGTMGESFERALTEFAALEPTVLSRDPWVVSFDNFLDADEVAAVLTHGEERYVRSTASGGRNDDEFIPLTSEIRTSYTTWCDNAKCLDDGVMKRITQRVSNVTRVPVENFEFMQLLRYLPCKHARDPDCQFYRRHHDTIPELARMQPGPRVYTFFLYLSDVEEGGGTKFDGGFTVHPKAGKALWWPATLPQDPFVSDDRTHHEALPVTRGTKYAANFWLHQYDYVSAHHSGCTS